MTTAMCSPVHRVAGACAMALVVSLGCDGVAEQPGEVPVRSAEVDLAIGQLDGGDAYLFGVIAGLAIDDAGRIYVADQQASTIRVFGPDGVYLRSLGREGAGPGELREPCCLGVAPDGLLWVRDNGNNRYVSFRVASDGAEPGPSVRMAHSDVNRWAPVTFAGNGDLIDVGSQFDTATRSSRTYRFHLPVSGTASQAPRAIPVPEPPAGAVSVAQIPIQRGTVSMMRHVYQPFGSRHLIAYGPGGTLAEGASGAYTIRVYGSDGALTHTIARPDVTTGPALTAQQRASADSAIARDARFVGRDPGAMPFQPPASHPPLTDLHFDETGRLWVRVTTLPGEPRRFHVYDTAGSHVETVEYPADVQFGIAGVVRRDLLVGTTTDSLGVPRVVRLRVIR